MAVKTKSSASGYGWVIVVITMLAGFTAPINMAKPISIAPVIMEQFGIGPDLFGWVVAFFYILGFVMAFPTTAIINKLGIRGGIVTAVAFGAIGGIVGALSTGLPMFLVSRVLEGAGFGVMGVAGSSAIAPWFKPEKRSVPLGIWSMWVAVCMCLCPIFFGWLIDAQGHTWTFIWWIAVIYDVVVAILFLALYREPADPQASQEEIEAANRGKANYGRAYKNKALWGLALIFFFDEAAFMAINGFLTTYVTEISGSLLFATSISSLFGFAGAICPLISGAIAQKFNNHRWILLFALIVGIAYTATVFTLKTPALFYGEAILAGIVGGFVPGIIWQFTPNTVEPDDIPAANSLVAFTQNLGMFVGAIAMGSAVSALGWSTGSYVAMLPCYIICIIVFFATALHKVMKIKKED